ncbi:hypothetical protein VDQ74_03230 [Xanthomonas campestris pv. campestris]|nr:hypothetical protein [Xanthomonas campestris pv. campestris]
MLQPALQHVARRRCATVHAWWEIGNCTNLRGCAVNRRCDARGSAGAALRADMFSDSATHDDLAHRMEATIGTAPDFRYIQLFQQLDIYADTLKGVSMHLPNRGMSAWRECRCWPCLPRHPSITTEILHAAHPDCSTAHAGIGVAPPAPLAPGAWHDRSDAMRRCDHRHGADCWCRCRLLARIHACSHPRMTCSVVARTD